MPPIPKPARSRRASETLELVHPIRVALNCIHGVRVWRNNVGMLEDRNGRPVRYGLAIGSADLVGLVRCGLWARFFALEVKRPGHRPTEEQHAWLKTVRELGGFACVVETVEQATAAVLRCREGDCE